VATDANSLDRLAQSCAGVNFRPKFFAAAATLGPQLALNPLLDGMGGGMQVAPWFATDDPGVAEYQRALTRYAPGVSPDAATITGWVSAKLFQLAAKNLSEPPTTADILNGLWSLKNNDLGGLTNPLTFTKDQNAPRAFCYWLVELHDGKWGTPAGTQRVCRP
jgi:branched-chain amino acid transport system substrate-binding protein